MNRIGVNVSTNEQIIPLKQQIKVSDLNLEYFQEKGHATSISQDCLKLFHLTEEEFKSVKTQKWYKRLWTTISGGNTRKLAQGCGNLAQAQQMLLVTLQKHAEVSAGSHTLLIVIARELRHFEGQQSQIVHRILCLADRIELIEEELAIQRNLILSDPENEYNWTDKDKLLLYKLMILASMSDGSISDSELNLVNDRFEDLMMNTNYEDQAEEFLKKQYDITDELRDIDSYKKRIVFFKHAFGVVHADGEYDPKEEEFISNLRKMLNIRNDDVSRIRLEFNKLQGDINTERLMTCMSALKSARAKSSTKEDLKKVDAKRKRMQDEAIKLEQGLAGLRGRLGVIGPEWIELFTDLFSMYVVHPARRKLSIYRDLEEATPLQYVHTINPSKLKQNTLANTEEIGIALKKIIARLDNIMSLQATVHVQVSELLHKIPLCDSGWNREINDLIIAGDLVRKAKGSDKMQVFGSGAAGAAGALLLGPIGVIPAIAYSLISNHSIEGKLKEALEHWDATLEKVVEATERWYHALQLEFTNILRLTLLSIDEMIGSYCEIEPVDKLIKMIENDTIELRDKSIVCIDSISVPLLGINTESNRDHILSIIQNNKKLLNHSHVYLYPTIPDRKLDRVLEKYASTIDKDDILMIFDNTVFGSAADGFCLSDTEILWHNIAEQPTSLSYDKVKTISKILKGSKTGNILINNRIIQIQILSKDEIKSFLQSIVKTLKEITSFIKRNS